LGNITPSGPVKKALFAVRAFTLAVKITALRFATRFLRAMNGYPYGFDQLSYKKQDALGWTFFIQRQRSFVYP